MNIGIMNDGHCMELTQEIFELLSPKGVFEWFELIEGTCEGDMTAITCEEKDPPHSQSTKSTKRSCPGNFTTSRFPTSLSETDQRDSRFDAGIGNSRVSRSISTEKSSLSVRDPSLSTSSPLC